MTTPQTDEPTPRRPLRLWPGVAAAVLLVLFGFVLIVVPEATMIGLLGMLVCVLAVVVWWVFLSRAPWSERLGALALMIAALAGTRLFLLHESVAKGNMGFQFFGYAIPVLSLAFVAWAVVTRRLADGPRRAWMAATILLACGVWTLVRSKGITSGGAAEFAWRWAETPEERLLAQASDAPAALPSVPTTVETPEKRPGAQVDDAPAAPAAAKTPEERLVTQAGDAPATLPPTPAAVETGADWPGFRGPHRDAVISGVRIQTDWASSPPVELWRRPIGPGVSSFAVHGDLLYTQEQRGEDEIVSCYKVTTGEPVWMHRDAARFWDPHVDVGPRATPALSNGRVYTFGATGILNALDARDGSVVWSRNAASDTGKDADKDQKAPLWGFVSSPLVVNDVVIVHAGKLVAYDLATGEPRWFGPAGGSYSSPHLLTIGGIAQILLLNHAGAISVAPADGKLLWEHPWPGVGIVQPALTAEGDLLISMIDSAAAPIGTRRIAVAHEPRGWTVEERWTSIGLKPSFSSFVVHKGHAFGFDGRLLACIDLKDGKRKWKGGHYGQGQLVLLPDQDLLLVLSEQGELALVKAAPDQFTELARFPAIKGKTWNHPVLAGDVLVVRNGEEMAAFRLALAGR